MITLQVRDFGPIISGAVELKPLTVFVGPNGSGKSYMSMLTYALLGRRLLERTAWRWSRHAFSIEKTKEIGAQLAKWLRSREVPETVSIGDLPADIARPLERAVQEGIDAFVAEFGQQLTHSFGAELSTLARAGGRTGKFSVSLTQGQPQWQLRLSNENNTVRRKASEFDLRNASLNLRRAVPGGMPRRGREKEFAVFIAMEDLYDQLYDSLTRYFPTRIYYLPAARSGILQSHKLLASMIISRAPLAGIEPLDIQRLSGVVADFMSNLLLLDAERRSPLAPVGEFLEQDLAQGRVVLTREVEYPEIYYQAGGERFPLHRASSMVSELAPLVLLLKYQLAPGSLLIIEEPESHLHPANQRKLARAIVKMIRAGVRVMITTHSDYFLTQLSNFVKLSQLPEERSEQGYDEEDFLTPEEVSCYLFDLDTDRGGSIIRPIEVNAEVGISEEGVEGVAESLYEEVVALDRASSR